MTWTNSLTGEAENSDNILVDRISKVRGEQSGIMTMSSVGKRVFAEISTTGQRVFCAEVPYLYVRKAEPKLSIWYSHGEIQKQKDKSFRRAEDIHGEDGVKGGSRNHVSGGVCAGGLKTKMKLKATPKIQSGIPKTGIIKSFKHC